ncbi:UNVERIFIED_CONTAM: hypothetical protein Sradi_3382600 [Sesamum radiatum]|uniref:Transposase n=1 Tax=Sesamum radiatum TaxID=300843 RepID=A0AAW2R492_SESRA
MYEEVGGRHSILNFYYKVPTDNLERGLRRIKTECPDLCLADLQNVHRGLDTPVVIYVEEEDGKPIQVIDRQGNMIPPENDAEITYLLEGINFDDIEFEDIGVRAEGDGDAVRGGSEGEVRGGAEGDGDEGGAEESEFDDSSDSDYVQPIESDDSDAPSLIKTIKGQHTCARTYDNSLAKTSYLAKRMENAIRDNPNIPIQQLKNTILRKCNVEVSRIKVLRAKKTALEAIRGADTKQYKYLWNYCETVRQHNPGSKLILRKVDGSDPPVFEKLYFSLFAMKSAFLSGCRPLIGLDGCFLKTCFKGQLLVAVGRDGNDNMVPIALAIVPIENRET